jgi:hypothetical protein
MAYQDDCSCRACSMERRSFNPLAPMYFIVCRVCGNKRCPKATDHTLVCTGSNEVGQEGSDYCVDPKDIKPGDYWY